MSFAFVFTIFFLAAALALGAGAYADNSVVEVRFENHQFSPANLQVPAGQALTIRVVNASNETIEFESFRLNREKAVQPGEAIAVRLPALSAGSYDFYDDFHQDVPQGSIVAK
ncbi:MAG TPA: cupredoxin domain-containing protein [Candidatus Binataceae bacterium]